MDEQHLEGDSWVVEGYDFGHLLLALNRRCSEELAIMRTVLRCIEDGSIEERAVQRPDPERLFHLSLEPPLPTNQQLQVAAIHGAFVGIVRALFDYVDRLHAVMSWATEPLIFDRAVRADEVAAFIQEKIEQRALGVAANRRLGNDRKIGDLQLSADDEVVCDGLREVRRTIEHHKAVAQREIVLTLFHPWVSVDGERFDDPNHLIEAGQRVQAGLEPRTVQFDEGSPIELSEDDIEALVRTVLNRLQPAMLEATIALGKAAQLPMENEEI